MNRKAVRQVQQRNTIQAHILFDAIMAYYGKTEEKLNGAIDELICSPTYPVFVVSKLSLPLFHYINLVKAYRQNKAYSSLYKSNIETSGRIYLGKIKSLERQLDQERINENAFVAKAIKAAQVCFGQIKPKSPPKCPPIDTQKQLSTNF